MVILNDEEIEYFNKRHELSDFEAYIKLKQNTDISIRKTANQWMWTERRLRTFLDNLARDGLIEKTLKNGKLEIRSTVDKAKPKRPKETDAKKPSIVTVAREAFENYFGGLFEYKYYWGAKDAVAMKQLIEKLKFQRSEKNMSISDDDVIDALKYLLGHITDPWILKNFTVPTINSKFNEILTQIRNGNRNDRKLNKDELARAIEDGFNAGIAQLKNK